MVKHIMADLYSKAQFYSTAVTENFGKAYFRYIVETYLFS